MELIWFQPSGVFCEISPPVSAGILGFLPAQEGRESPEFLRDFCGISALSKPNITRRRPPCSPLGEPGNVFLLQVMRCNRDPITSSASQGINCRLIEIFPTQEPTSAIGDKLRGEARGSSHRGRGVRVILGRTRPESGVAEG